MGKEGRVGNNGSRWVGLEDPGKERERAQGEGGDAVRGKRQVGEQEFCSKPRKITW